MEKIIIVTGGSRGIGAATALAAAKAGYAVCVNYLRNREAADNVVEQIQGMGGRAIAVAANVAHEDEIVRLFETVDSELGTVTALVNNTGIVEKASRLDQFDAARLQRLFNTNVVGSFICAREAVRRMSTLRGGHGGAIVNVSSGASKSGSPGEFIDYASTKGAIDTLTLGLAREVATEGIRVNAVRPGLIDTDLHDDTGVEGRLEKFVEVIPMRRVGVAQEIADAILWLLSDQASFTTGALLDVAGGR